MKRWACIVVCAVLTAAIAAFVVYRYGLDPWSLALVLLLLVCPVLVSWLTWRQSTRTEREIEDAVRREIRNRRR